MENIKIVRLIENIKIIRLDVCLISGLVGSAILYLFGGWDKDMQTLVTVMIIDYLTGLMVAGVFKKSPKTDSGGLKSDIGFKGLCKKFIELMIIAMLYRIDVYLGISYLRDLGIIGFVVNEVISITENAGLVIELPPIVKQAIDILNKKAAEKNQGN